MKLPKGNRQSNSKPVEAPTAAPTSNSMQTAPQTARQEPAISRQAVSAVAKPEPTKPATAAPPAASAESKTSRQIASPQPGPARSASRKPVTIEAKINVGFGNTLYLRGEGQGLDWDRGIPLTCTDASTWRWTAEVDQKLKFKLLLNDAVWAKGEDVVVAPGEKVQIAPAF